LDNIKIYFKKEYLSVTVGQFWATWNKAIHICVYLKEVETCNSMSNCQLLKKNSVATSFQVSIKEQLSPLVAAATFCKGKTQSARRAIKLMDRPTVAGSGLFQSPSDSQQACRT
jgi:hypothetical protein